MSGGWSKRRRFYRSEKSSNEEFFLEHESGKSVDFYDDIWRLLIGPGPLHKAEHVQPIACTEVAVVPW